MGGPLIAVLAAVVLALAAAPAARADSPVDLNWAALLPELPSPAGSTGGPQPRCQKATLRCMKRLIRGMRRTQDRYGCDHRAVFATTYLTLTRELRDTMRRDPGFFRDRDAIIFEAMAFEAMWQQALAGSERGGPVAPAWRIAFDAARDGDLSGTGDMLLGINAHVQNDMPHVVAAITLRDAAGNSRKPDHDRMNEVLDRAFGPVVRAVSARYDPLAAWHTHNFSPATDVFGMELVRMWREGVWRNAERLVLARDDAEREQVSQTIAQQAAASALLIRTALQGPPGHRAARDAYCASRLGG